jgi:hydroxyacylglutathione hydrolase
MKIKKLVVPPLATNCYLVWEEGGDEALVIDPGPKPGQAAEELKKRGLRAIAIIQTHGHWDHSAGSSALSKKTGAPILRHPDEPASGLLHRARPADGANVRDLNDGDTIRLGANVFTVISTPGHSPGSISLYVPGTLFCGDLLFSGSVGRWDLAGGSLPELIKSLRERLSRLPDDVQVLPGHGPATNLGQERQTNPFFTAPIKELE